MTEVRIAREGSLRWVQASGTGSTWATASAPTSGFAGFVTDFSHTSAQTVVTIMERGTPHHHKISELAPIDVSVTFQWTGTYPVAGSGAGASVPMFHLEFKALRPEDGAPTGYYYQFYGCAMENDEFTEAADGNTHALTFKALGMSANASGFLS